MKKRLLIVAILIGFVQLSYGQEEELNSKFAVGFQIGQYQQDFGLGLNISSPYFADNRVAFRLRGNIMWNEHLDPDGLSTWSNYSNLSIGIVGVGGQIGNSIRLYGEGGLIFLFPSSNFSSESAEMGGYGLFGFEFYLNPHGTYFIEIGGVGTGAREDKLASQAIYSNGLLIDTGFRIQF